MINTKELVSTFSIPEKIALLRDLYNDITGYGEEGDTELAHVNIFEAAVLKSLGGSGTINEVTGLREYKGGGGGGQQQQPAVTSTTQTAEFPPELRPHIERITGEAETEYDVARDEGFIPFGGPQIAGFRPEQLQAQELGRQQFGTGLAGTALGDPSTYYQPALGAGLQGVTDITSEQIQERINPFQQNVIDIATREAERTADVERQRINAEAVGQGAFGGSRAGVQQAEANRNLQQNLADIQARGLYGGYDRAVTSLENERRRQLTGAQQLGTLGELAADRSRKQVAGLSGVGEVQQAQRQQALDLARQQFEQEKFFPKGELQQYQSILRGLPLAPGSVEVQRKPIIQTPLSSQLLGAGLAGLNIYGQSGGFGARKTGGQVGSFANGGIVSLQGGTLGESIEDDSWLVGRLWNKMVDQQKRATERPEDAETYATTESWPEGAGPGYSSEDYGLGKDPRDDPTVPEYSSAVDELIVKGDFEFDSPDRYQSLRQPDELQALIESQAAYDGTMGPASEKYAKLITDYQQQQKDRPVWTAGFGPASQAVQGQLQAAQSARGGLGAFNQPTIADLLITAANAGAAGIGEERASRQAMDFMMAKEAATAESAGRQQHIENLLRFKEAGGKPKEFTPSSGDMGLLAATSLNSAGFKVDVERPEGKAVLNNFNAGMRTIADALSGTPEHQNMSEWDHLQKGAELALFAFDPKTQTMDTDVLNVIIQAAKNQQAGRLDTEGRIPPLFAIEQAVILAQELGRRRNWPPHKVSETIRAWITAGDLTTEAKLRVLDEEEVGAGGL